jgi:hypothetical protein
MATSLHEFRRQGPPEEGKQSTSEESSVHHSSLISLAIPLPTEMRTFCRFSLFRVCRDSSWEVASRYIGHTWISKSSRFYRAYPVHCWHSTSACLPPFQFNDFIHSRSLRRWSSFAQWVCHSKRISSVLWTVVLHLISCRSFSLSCSWIVGRTRWMMSC